MRKTFPKFKAGIYKHYKGPLYLVLGLAHDANYENRALVVYVGLELDKAKEGPRLSVRTYEDFYAWTDPSTGQAIDQKDPNAVCRFTFIGQTLDDT